MACERSDWSEDPDAGDLQAVNSAHGEGRKCARDLRFGKVHWMMCECMSVSMKRLRGEKYLLHIQSHGGLKWSMRAEERRKEKLQEPIRHTVNVTVPGHGPRRDWVSTKNNGFYIGGFH